MMVHDWLTERARQTPQKLALVIEGRRWTYGELDTAVAHLAAHLHHQGIRPGNLIAALLPNSFAYVCLIHALPRLGAILVPLNTRLTPAELQWQIDHVGARWLVTDEENWSIVNIQLLIVNEETIATTKPLKIDHWPLSIDNLQAIIFTSGTSGRPKGAMLTYANHYHSALASAERLGVQEEDLWLSVLPLYHVGGLAVIFRSCLYGTAVSLHPRFDLDAINHDLDANPITLISLVPTMLRRLLQSRTHWPATLRLILLGGAAAPEELIAQANALPRRPLSIHNSQFTVHSSLFPLVAPTYGLTEAASQVSTALPGEAARKPGTAGKPLRGITVKILDEQGNELPPGAYGEIVVSGPTVMAGYFNQKQETENKKREASGARSSIGNGQSSIRTGDIGYLDTEGDLFVVQRRSDLIVSGGENVYPAEVEAALKRHPVVAEACVVGVPDTEWGQRVAAMIVTQGEITAVDLLTFLRQQLAGYKVPRQILFVAELPLTASGKIARQQVLEEIVKREA